MIFACTEPTDTSEGIEVEEAGDSSSQIQLTQDQFDALNMEWGSVEERNLSEYLSLQGMVRVPTEGRQNISAIYGGYVSGLKLIEGEAIRRGQVLFYIENPEFIRLQQEYLEIKSQMAFLEAESLRQEKLYGEQIAAQKNYLKAKADYQAAGARLAGLEKQLSLLNINAASLTPDKIQSKIAIYSPINGFVESIHSVPGSYINATDKALTLLNRDHLHVELIVFERDATKLKIGQKVKVSVPDLDQEEMWAEVYVISQSVNEDRQVMVHAHLIDEKLEKNLVPGMYLEARLDLDEKAVLVLPESAVVMQEEKNFVLLQKEKTDTGFILEKVAVRVGNSRDGFIEIIPNDQLAAGSVVLIRGAFGLI